MSSISSCRRINQTAELDAGFATSQHTVWNGTCEWCTKGIGSVIRPTPHAHIAGGSTDFCRTTCFTWWSTTKLGLASESERRMTIWKMGWLVHTASPLSNLRTTKSFFSATLRSQVAILGKSLCVLLTVWERNVLYTCFLLWIGKWNAEGSPNSLLFRLSGVSLVSQVPRKACQQLRDVPPDRVSFSGSFLES